MIQKILHKGEESLLVGFREFRDSDAPKLVQCIREEYGDTYRHQKFYQPEFLVQEVRQGHCFFLVAEVEGAVVGTLGLKFNPPRESMCEWITGVVLKRYRRYGIMNHLFRLVADKMQAMEDISSGYGFSVTRHDISQRSMGRLGFRPCGFLLSNFIACDIIYSFVRDENLKLHQVIIVCNAGKKDVGILHIPAELEALARQVYNSLGIEIEVDSRLRKAEGNCEYYVEQNEKGKNCIIWLDKIGNNLTACLEDIQSHYTDPMQTFSVYLNISEATAVGAYNELLAMGYFFAGWRPYLH